MIDMSKALTDTGLNLPANCTEEQFFEAGRFLARIEHGMQWAIGDWYNAIPWGDKQAACEKAGLNYETAHRYSMVCSHFKFGNRFPNLSFKHHFMVAVEAVSDAQRQSLLKEAAEQKWSSSRLKKERDILLGTYQEKIAVTGFDDRVGALVETLPASTSKKVKAGINRLANDLKHSFQDQVEAELKSRLELERARLAKEAQRLKQEQDKLDKMNTSIDALMTEKEFKKLLSYCHPDKALPGKERLANECFLLLQRMKDAIPGYLPSSVRRNRGWSA